MEPWCEKCDLRLTKVGELNGSALMACARCEHNAKEQANELLLRTLAALELFIVGGADEATAALRDVHQRIVKYAP